jgi:hypothetical protein
MGKDGLFDAQCSLKKPFICARWASGDMPTPTHPPPGSALIWNDEARVKMTVTLPGSIIDYESPAALNALKDGFIQGMNRSITGDIPKQAVHVTFSARPRRLGRRLAGAVLCTYEVQILPRQYDLDAKLMSTAMREVNTTLLATEIKRSLQKAGLPEDLLRKISSSSLEPTRPQMRQKTESTTTTTTITSTTTTTFFENETVTEPPEPQVRERASSFAASLLPGALAILAAVPALLQVL